MPRPDCSGLTLDAVARQLLGLPDGADCLELRLYCDGRPVRVYVARGRGAEILSQALEQRPLIGRIDFDPE